MVVNNGFGIPVNKSKSIKQSMAYHKELETFTHNSFWSWFLLCFPDVFEIGVYIYNAIGERESLDNHWDGSSRRSDSS